MNLRSGKAVKLRGGWSRQGSEAVGRPEKAVKDAVDGQGKTLHFGSGRSGKGKKSR